MVLIVAAIGKSGSGKTVTIEYLIKQFSAEGYKIGAIKHIHHKDFTIDTEEKNTWRYTQAGAKIIAASSPHEIAIIKKTQTENIDQIIKTLKREEKKIDIIFIEGYHDLVSKRTDILKILTTKDPIYLQEVLNTTVEPILAITGPIANSNSTITQKYPIIKIPQEGKKLINLIKQQLTPTTSKKPETNKHD
ncbi:MAG: molybdopterin-guanine dinucleotide biosynthesis protein B [Nitrososphaerota archaeon]|jgi:molybdopterin-guanine dinucleotide biosynthesis protein MobB|nr:molybdopterin-guanine dinucleotide biosynthesis protein B [Nitrososphaerota archaeon]